MTDPSGEPPDDGLVDGRAGYGAIEVLHGVKIRCSPGGVVALVGRNGAGKSTTLRCLAGLLPLRSGSVRWFGQDMTDLAVRTRALAGVTLVPDTLGTFLDLTVGENLALFAGHGTTAAHDAAEPALQLFPELRNRLGQRAATLSGGEQQMLALSRAFLRPGRALLLDEVSRGLSPAVTERVYDALADLRGPQRCIVVVEQYLDTVLRAADTVYVLTRGSVSFAGTPAELADATAGS
jgi:branched-chain amino acid transport system ATP-binding protein